MPLRPASVWIDAQSTQGTGSAERGLGRHVVEVVSAIHATAPGTLGSVRLQPELPVPAPFEPLAEQGLIGWGLGPPAAGEAPAIYHIPSPFEVGGIERIWPDWARHGRDPVRTVVTLHDLVPLVMEDLYFGERPGFKPVYEARLGLIRQAHQVLAISDNTAADAVELLGVSSERITLIESGVSDAFSSLVSSPEEAEGILASSYPRIRDGFLLYVGGGDPRKNMRGTIEAFSCLPESRRHAHQLVIVCRLGPHETAELRVFAHRLGIDDSDLFFAGFVPDRELAAMYRRCLLFVFPSLYEGFGLPVLEAMSCDAPVAASNTSSIPEVLGDLDATFDPADPEDIAETLLGVIDHPERLERLRERSRRRVARYTWEKTAAKTLEGYEAALSVPAGRSVRSKKRKRIALATPWPPQDSPAASASMRLVALLTEHADVDVIVADGEGTDTVSHNGVRFWSVDELDWLLELRGHDALAYALDGSKASRPLIDALSRHPGTVILHEPSLAGREEIGSNATAVLAPPAGDDGQLAYAELLEL